MAKKSWFRYVDESGRSWRVQTTAELAEIGGLDPVQPDGLPPLPKTIKARYVWLAEAERPKDRLRVSVKVILQRDRLKEIYGRQLRWEVAGKQMMLRSYYGEVVIAT